MALILLLGGVLPSASATVPALVSRLVMTVGDLGWSGVAVLAERLRKRSAASGQTGGPVPGL